MIESIQNIDFPSQPNKHTPLTIRRPERRRASTQTWHFSDDGRLRLKSVQTLVVQVDAESRGVRSGAPVVLGPIPTGCHSSKVGNFLTFPPPRRKKGDGGRRIDVARALHSLCRSVSLSVCGQFAFWLTRSHGAVYTASFFPVGLGRIRCVPSVDYICIRAIRVYLIQSVSHLILSSKLSLSLLSSEHSDGDEYRSGADETRFRVPRRSHPR